MILESNTQSLVLTDDRPQDLLLRLKTKVKMTMDGTYFGAAYGTPDYEIRATGLVKDQATLNAVSDFFEQVDNNKIYYTDHNNQKWACYLNPDEQRTSRRSKDVWTLTLRMIGTQL